MGRLIQKRFERLRPSKSMRTRQFSVPSKKFREAADAFLG